MSLSFAPPFSSPATAAQAADEGFDQVTVESGTITYDQWTNTKATEPGAYQPGPVCVKTGLVEFRRSGFIPLPAVHAERSRRSSSRRPDPPARRDGR